MNRTILGIALLFSVLPLAEAALVLDDIHFDPAIIASGDEVDIVIQYHDDSSFASSRVGDPDYRFAVRLESDDDLTREYVRVQDREGDDLRGIILAGGYYNKRFRVKVAQDAPPGNYEFRLVGQWYRDGQPEASEQFLRFTMPVKKEGIILDVASLVTTPSAIRPGDDYVELTTRLENVGEKDAKRVELRLSAPEGITASYSDDNRQWIGRVNAGEAQEVTFFLDVVEDVAPGTYPLTFTMEYLDLDNNAYATARELQLRIKEAPRLEVVNVSGWGRAGGTAELRVTVRNVGTEAAEATDVRLLKQSAQPFTMDVRSDYLGELEPGQERTAHFMMDVSRGAVLKEHDVQLLLRAKGDSDRGDDAIYTFTRHATLSVTGTAPNVLLWVGVAASLIVVLVLIVKVARGKR